MVSYPDTQFLCYASLAHSQRGVKITAHIQHVAKSQDRNQKYKAGYTYLRMCILFLLSEVALYVATYSYTFRYSHMHATAPYSELCTPQSNTDDERPRGFSEGLPEEVSWKMARTEMEAT